MKVAIDRCEQIRIELAHVLADGRLRTLGGVESHLRGCRDCRKAWREMRLSWHTLDVLEDEEVPLGAARSVRSWVLQKLEDQAYELESLRTGRWALMSMVLGVVFSVTSMWALNQTASLNAFPPQLLLSMGALWAAVYASVVLLVARGRRTEGRVVTRGVALAGLVAMGLSLVLGGNWSIGHLTELCQASPWIRDAMGQMTNAQFYFVAGGLYSLVPLSIAAVLLGVKTPARPLVAGIAVGGVFMALALPSVLLQCGAFSVGASLSWIFGVAAGSLTGGPIGCTAAATMRRYFPVSSFVSSGT